MLLSSYAMGVKSGRKDKTNYIKEQKIFKIPYFPSAGLPGHVIKVNFVDVRSFGD